MEKTIDYLLLAQEYLNVEAQLYCSFSNTIQSSEDLLIFHTNHYQNISSELKSRLRSQKSKEYQPRKKSIKQTEGQFTLFEEQNFIFTQAETNEIHINRIETEISPSDEINSKYISASKLSSKQERLYFFNAYMSLLEDIIKSINWFDKDPDFSVFSTFEEAEQYIVLITNIISEAVLSIDNDLFYFSNEELLHYYYIYNYFYFVTELFSQLSGNKIIYINPRMITTNCHWKTIRNRMEVKYEGFVSFIDEEMEEKSKKILELIDTKKRFMKITNCDC